MRKALMIGVIAVWLAPGGAALAGTSLRVVTDFYTGLAIEGYDPVAYFTEHAALEGRDAIEARREGAIWRFRNEGNRAAFLANSDIYGPQFGGYDPLEIADGKTVSGYPKIWLVVDERLYLFANDKNRRQFMLTPDAIARDAARKWPDIRESLPR